MTPLRTENVDLNLEDNIAHMRVSGPIAKETLSASFDWIKTVQEQLDTPAKDELANDNFALHVELPQSAFHDLGEISAQFENISRILRHSTAADKCALITDSLFIRNKAKIEGAVIPGMEIRTFDLDETKPATRWLKDEPLTPEIEITESVADEVQSDNPWDNLKIKNLSL